ncbi:ABC transporter permease [Companilactobacillus metriopterae]|uniref:ABC transporter permease n=1 Tax=Companilactobacillus metriopterae TaxID=1909267 RepID=UPI00100BE1B7|nr:ABC transporter permease [Companilactobacillus metriopterae]
MFLSKIARNNIKANKNMIIPFFIAGSLLTAFNFILLNMIESNSFKNIVSADVVTIFLKYSFGIILAITVVFMFYADNYLSQSRNRELSLYSMLGMNKRQITGVITIEEILTYIATQVVGIFLGIGFSKLSSMLLFKMMSIDMKMNYRLSFKAILEIIAIFAIIYLFIILRNSIKIYRLNLQEFFNSTSKTENIKKIPWIRGIISFIILFTGYILALMTKNPQKMLPVFLLAVGLVIVGIFMTFSFGSIVVLKFLKGRKSYYKIKNFVMISGLTHRLRRSSVSLATICLLCTATLVTVSVTACLFAGRNQILEEAYPREVMVHSDRESKKENLSGYVESSAKKHDIKLKDHARLSIDASISAKKDENNFKEISNPAASDLYQFNIINIDNYNKDNGTNLKLSSNKVYYYTRNNDEVLDKKFKLKNNEWTVEKQIKDNNFLANSQPGKTNIYLVMNSKEEKKYFKDKDTFVYDGFNIKDTGSKKQFQNFMDDSASHAAGNGFVSFAHNEYVALNIVMGGFLFLGGLLAIVFMLITALVMYYRQLAEGLSDRDDYIVMNEIGMGVSQVKKIVQRQVNWTSAAPLIFSAVNLLFAFTLLNRLLQYITPANPHLFIEVTLITLLVFAVVYAVLSFLTGRVYFSLIKNNKLNDRREG